MTINRQDRRTLLRNIDGVAADTIKAWHTWQDRFGAYCALLQAVHKGEAGDTPSNEEMAEFSGALARHIIDKLGGPPIADLYQSLLYFGSSWAPHRIAAQTWNRQHQAELEAFQRERPDVPLLTEVKTGGPTGRYTDVDGERVYFLNLRQALYIMVADEDPTPPMVAIRRFMRVLASRFRNGDLRADGDAEITTQPHDTKGRMVEITALYLEGRLTPTNAETEIALGDSLERLHADHAELTEMLFAVAGRHIAKWACP